MKKLSRYFYIYLINILVIVSISICLIILLQVYIPSSKSLEEITLLSIDTLLFILFYFISFLIIYFGVFIFFYFFNKNKLVNHFFIYLLIYTTIPLTLSYIFHSEDILPFSKQYYKFISIVLLILFNYLIFYWSSCRIFFKKYRKLEI
jgi:hypothetical protein